MDGTLDIWDIIFKQKDPSLSIQVTDDPLYSLRIHDNGRFVVTGSKDGTTALIELSDNLCTLQVREKYSCACGFLSATEFSVTDYDSTSYGVIVVVVVVV